MSPVAPRHSARTTNHAPAQFTASHYVADVHFGTFASSLGVLLVAATSHGICFVALGDDAAALQNDLHAAFPRASVTEDTPHLREWAREIEHLLTGAAPSVALPLRTSGTPFQERVWAELRRIPPGERCSYQELARRIGKPTAARAVAQACASNRVAVLVPCHRVVRGTGDLGGYRWGVERKRALLEAERAAVEHAAVETSRGSAA
ncbi:MAG: methylated-DNA--[protein]-cysteine S-methyltransferase [Gemmatimonadaceae bacterium]